ncbi:MAG: hypothetical protein IJT73_06025 [Selenomonadaceae bacterium]|nr:hypothetical protein [Selenomonadaceae bacterium]
MKKFFLLLLIIFFTSSTVNAAANPSCILMKFTDDTRFDLVESAESLSDLVMEKLLASGKFRLMETRPIDENIEIQLYNEKLRDLKFLEDAVNNSEINLTPLFEGVGFDENRAQSIATAQVGQIIDPEITKKIGSQHNAEYLIQGTIINLGTGAWWSDDFEKISTALNAFSGLANTSVPLGMVGDILSGIDVGKIGVGVQCDLRVIKAETGEVVWSKRVVGVHDQVNLSLAVVQIGSRKLNNNFYAKAMDKAAQKIVDALITDSKNIFQ